MHENELVVLLMHKLLLLHEQELLLIDWQQWTPD